MSLIALRRTIAGVAIATTAAIGIVASTTDPAAAVSSCTLKGSLPSKVVINKSNVTFYSTLSGSGNCKPVGGEFADASAYFDGPDGTADYAFWDAVGDKYRFDIWAWQGHPGTYALRDGDALIWDADYNDVPIRWTTTKTVIRYASLLSVATQRSGRKVTISGTAKKYTAFDGYGAYKTTVYLQRRAKSTKTYRTIKTLKSSSSGKISYSYSTTSRYFYRLVIKDSSSVWGATSARSYR